MQMSEPMFPLTSLKLLFSSSFNYKWITMELEVWELFTLRPVWYSECNPNPWNLVRAFIILRQAYAVAHTSSESPFVWSRYFHSVNSNYQLSVFESLPEATEAERVLDLGGQQWQWDADPQTDRLTGRFFVSTDNGDVFSPDGLISGSPWLCSEVVGGGVWPHRPLMLWLLALILGFNLRKYAFCWPARDRS